MILNPKWDRWIRASVNKYISDQLALVEPTLKIHPEGAPEQDRKGAQDWLEMRMDGPRYDPEPGEWKITVEINILINSIINEQSIYRHREIAGKVAQILSTVIPLMEYGDDRSMQFGCLQLDSIATHYYDRVGPDTPLKQVTVDCFGVCYLSGG
jgi:hypothetical protein